MENNKNFKVGDVVWIWERWSERPVSGIIEKIYSTDSKLLAELGGECGVARRFLDDLFQTKEDLLEFRKEKDKRLVLKYKDQINSIEDLIRFMYDETISTGACEYTDYCTRTAAREKAKELLGIELE